MARHDDYEPGGREPVGGIARKLWDKAVRETGEPPVRLSAFRPGRLQQATGACSHSMDVMVDGEMREYLAWWPTADELATPLRECWRERDRTYWIGPPPSSRVASQ